MKRILLWTSVALIAAIATSVRPAEAKDLKQLVTVSFSGYDDLMQGVGMVGKLAGMPGLPMLLDAQLQQLGAGEALKHFDKKQPWVLTVATDEDGEEFSMRGFLPVRDVKKLIDSSPFPLQPDDAGDGVLELKGPERSLFIKQHGAWAVLSNKKANVSQAPEDPVALAGGMQEKYHLGARFSVKSIPAGLRKKFLDIAAFSVQANQQQMPGESDEQFAARTKMLQRGVEQLRTMVNDLDAVTVGVKLDEATSSAFLELTSSFLPGSVSAKKLARASRVKTQFAGVISPDAAVTMHVAQQLDPSDVADAKANVASLRANALAELAKQGLPDDQANVAKQIVGDIMDVIDKTLDSGKLDFAASLTLKPKALTFVAGMQIAEGAKIESAIKQLIEQVAKENPGAANLVKLNAEKHSGVRFHIASLPVNMMDDADAREKLSTLVGDSLEAVIGIGDTKLYVAIGRDASSSLKKAIDGSGAELKSFANAELSIALADLLQFVASVSDDNQKQIAQMIGNVIKTSAGKDHIRLTASPIANGVQIRLTAEEGVLKAAGIFPAMAGASGIKGRSPAKPR